MQNKCLLALIRSLRLFKLVGGKGYEKALKLAQSPEDHDDTGQLKVGSLRVSAGMARLDGKTPSSNLMLRTLECKNVHTG